MGVCSIPSALAGREAELRLTVLEWGFPVPCFSSGSLSPTARAGPQEGVHLDPLEGDCRSPTCAPETPLCPPARFTLQRWEEREEKGKEGGRRFKASSQIAIGKAFLGLDSNGSEQGQLRHSLRSSRYHAM